MPVLPIKIWFKIMKYVNPEEPAFNGGIIRQYCYSRTLHSWIRSMLLSQIYLNKFYYNLKFVKTTNYFALTVDREQTCLEIEPCSDPYDSELSRTILLTEMGFEAIFVCCSSLKEWLPDLIPKIRDFHALNPKQKLLMK